MVMAVAGRGTPSLLARPGPVRSGSAPRSRRRRVGRRGRASPGGRGRLVRRCRPVLGPNGDDPDRRLCRLPDPPRRDHGRKGRHGRRGRCRRRRRSERGGRVADALRSPRNPRLVGGRRLRRPGHAPAAPGGGTSAYRRGSGRGAVAGPGRGPGGEPRSGAAHAAHYGSYSEPVRGRGSDRCTNPGHSAVQRYRTAGCVRDRERHELGARDGSEQGEWAEHRRSTAGRSNPSGSSSAEPAGQRPGPGLGVRRASGGSGSAAPRRCCVQRRGPAGRLRPRERGPCIVRGRLAGRVRLHPGVRTYRTAVIGPVGSGRGCAAGGEGWRSTAAGRASGHRSRGDRARVRERAAPPIRSWGRCLCGCAGGERHRA